MFCFQVYGNYLSYFLNGSDAGMSARGSYTLAGPVLDGPGMIRVGQTKNGIEFTSCDSIY